MHISLDGFVAGPNGEMNWIKVDEEIFDFVSRRIGETDTALYGRVTYQMMESYWPTAGDQPNASKHDVEHAKWYKEAGKIVLSASMRGAQLPNTTIISDNISQQLNEIKQSGSGSGKEILVFGSPTTTHALIEQNLIDGYWLFVNPVVLGQGIPLFTQHQAQTKLKLTSSQQFTSGVVQLSYLVDKG